jgi:hypothetical protein
VWGKWAHFQVPHETVGGQISSFKFEAVMGWRDKLLKIRIIWGWNDVLVYVLIGGKEKTIKFRLFTFLGFSNK